MNVGSSQWWSIASTKLSCHHFIVAMLTPNCHNLGDIPRCNCVRSTASTMSSCHHFIATLTLNYQNLGQLCQCNCVRRVRPYAYQQQMMVLKHFSYIQYRWGKQSVVVYSLNYVIMPSFHCSHSDPNIPKSGPTLPVELYKGAPICLSITYDGAQTLYTHPIWMRDAISSGLQPQQ